MFDRQPAAAFRNLATVMRFEPPTAVIVQLSDVHIGSRLAGRDVAAGQALRRALAAVGSLGDRVDLLLVTGDLVDAGADEEYDELFSLLDQVAVPTVLLPGNHDDRARLRARLAGRQPIDPSLPGVCTVVEVGPLRVIGLDSWVAHEEGGRLGAEQCAWLDAQLSADGRPTIVAVHHPPVRIGHAILDTMFLDDADAFGDVVGRHPHVERVVCGHAHRSVTVRWRGTVVSVAPSSIRQFSPAFAEVARLGTNDEQPGLLVHAWVGGALASHAVGFDGRADRP